MTVRTSASLSTKSILVFILILICWEELSELKKRNLSVLGGPVYLNFLLEYVYHLAMNSFHLLQIDLINLPPL
jgi:hypothetical protein